MYGELVNQVSEVADVFVNDRGFHGLIGILIFAFVVVLLMRFPQALRRHTGFWFIEAIIAAVSIYIIAAAIGSGFQALGILEGAAEISPLFSVPPVLMCA